MAHALTDVFWSQLSALLLSLLISNRQLLFIELEQLVIAVSLGNVHSSVTLDVSYPKRLLDDIDIIGRGRKHRHYD